MSLVYAVRFWYMFVYFIYVINIYIYICAIGPQGPYMAGARGHGPMRSPAAAPLGTSADSTLSRVDLDLELD